MNFTTTAPAAKYRCPVRATERPQTPGPDRWLTVAAVVDGISPCCSYCGSLDPDMFMARVRDGWIVEPADVSFACYLDEPYNSEELERIKRGNAVWCRIRCARLDAGATDEEATAAADAHWSKYEAATHRGRTVAKLNYAHLTPAQRGEFLELHDSGRMRVAWPGWFYVRPGFERSATRKSELAGPVTQGWSR